MLSSQASIIKDITLFPFYPKNQKKKEFFLLKPAILFLMIVFAL